MTKKISLDKLDLRAEINNILKNYNEECFEEVETEAENIGKNAVSTLKGTLNTYKIRTGEYNKSWTMTRESGALSFEKIVHNKKHYRLTHLLENGHATSNGGRTRAFPHIAPVQEKANQELLKLVTKIYGGG